MTAEEFIKDAQQNPKKGWTTKKMLIEFAKYHVEKALKEANEKARAFNKGKFPGDINPQVDMDSILNAYPLDLIK